ncbi:hypothetical protein Lal_00049582 [Lupinus albus]|nr:hypothetical protein Lal_00049582 [Lupinus albus]
MIRLYRQSNGKQEEKSVKLPNCSFSLEKEASVLKSRDIPHHWWLVVQILIAAIRVKVLALSFWQYPSATKYKMAAELVSAATTEKLVEIDWMKNIAICELVAHDHRQARDVVKAIKKRLGNKKPNTQLYAVMLLEMLMNNIGDHIHKQVIDTGIIPILVKIVKKKSNFPVRERIFLLLNAAQTSLGGASGKFPQYYNAYYDLVWKGDYLFEVCHKPQQRLPMVLTDQMANDKRCIPEFLFGQVSWHALHMLPLGKGGQSAGVQFPQRAQAVESNRPSSQPNRTNNVPNKEHALPRHGGVAQPADSQTVPGSRWLLLFSFSVLVVDSIIQKASDVLEVLKEVLDAVDAQHSQGGRDEFTLDLVEQCSFQKQRVMHLVMASRDERIVSRAIELNEQLQQVLARHDDMLSAKATTTANHFGHEDEEEEPEQLFQRLRKGKACARPEDEEAEPEFPRLGLLEERLNCPLIRPLSLSPSRRANTRPAPAPIPPPSARQNSELPHVAIPPPPVKHIERERFFQENKKGGATLAGHLRGLSLNSHNGSSSHSGSLDFSDWSL